MTPYLCIHSGAGYHSPKNKARYHKLLNRVLKETHKLLLAGCSATEAVEYSIKLLEDNELTNAGISGSNICLDGNIESDASIMTSEGSGAVAAIPMTNINKSKNIDIEICKNPISIAKLLHDQTLKGPDRTGRIPPIFLVGTNAQLFAKDNNLDMICYADARNLVVKNQLNQYRNHIEILKSNEDKDIIQVMNINGGVDVYEPKIDLGISDDEKDEEIVTVDEDEDEFQDTVGAICIDQKGNIASGVSSGGISLKRPGRVGEAAIPGSGIWVIEQDTISIGCSISGTGEQIMKTLLASSLSNSLLNSQNIPQSLTDSFTKSFLCNPVLKNDKLKMAGALILVKDDDKVEFWLIHSTPSFCVGSVGSKGKVQFQISRKRTDKEFCIKGSLG
jgi:taspase (threonine aspartase 1)